MGVLARWRTSALANWRTGSLVRWFAGSLGWDCAGERRISGVGTAAAARFKKLAERSINERTRLQKKAPSAQKLAPPLLIGARRVPHWLGGLRKGGEGVS